jgi:hypothetical protein
MRRTKKLLAGSLLALAFCAAVLPAWAGLAWSSTAIERVALDCPPDPPPPPPPGE